MDVREVLKEAAQRADAGEGCWCGEASGHTGWLNCLRARSAQYAARMETDAPTALTYAQIAEVAHAAVRGHQHLLGDPVHAPWDGLPEDERSALTEAVEAYAGETPEEWHEKWRAERVAAGWTFGVVDSRARRMSPYLVPYGDLSLVGRTRAALFVGVVRALAGDLD